MWIYSGFQELCIEFLLEKSLSKVVFKSVKSCCCTEQCLNGASRLLPIYDIISWIHYVFYLSKLMASTG